MLGKYNACRSAFRRDHHKIMGEKISRMNPLLQGAGYSLSSDMLYNMLLAYCHQLMYDCHQAEVAMLQNLFSSRVRVELLDAFFLKSDKDLYPRELERITGEDYKSISRELKNLEKSGLLISRRQGNLKYYRLDKGFLLYDELRSIFMKTRGAVSLLKSALDGISPIDFALIYGSIAAGAESEASDIDLMVIGKTKIEQMVKLLRAPEETLGREINTTLYSLSEIKQRYKANDPFITDVLGGPIIMLIGEEVELRRALE
jgi:DNA-binding transcriptional ArsR family regulator